MKKLMVWGVVGVFSTTVQALTLSEYVDQVKKQNRGAQASDMQIQSGRETARDRELLLAPTLVASSKYSEDKSLPLFPGQAYDKVTTFTTLLGVKKLTTFGLAAEVDYEYDTIDVENITFGSLAMGNGSNYQSHPSFMLTQSLWSNGFGRATRAQADLLEAQGLSKGLSAEFQKESIVVDAEVTYWQLVNTRRQVEILTQAVAQAKRILDWNIRRRSQNLNEVSDLLQAKAAYESRTLDLQTAKDLEREAKLIFNSKRFMDSDEMQEPLDDMQDLELAKVQVPSRQRVRTDVKAAEQSARLAAAQAITGLEKDKPQFDIFGSYGLTTQDIHLSTTATNPQNKPTTAVGLRFAMPLDFTSMNMARQGYQRDQMAAEANYQQKIFDEQRDWKNLTQKFVETQRRFQMSVTIEETQQSKMLNERQRFNNGRTTTYQVLMFEQDYLQSRLNRVRTEGELLNLISQMKLYQEAR